MNEQDIIKRSIKLFAVMCFLCLILGILLHDMSHLIGYVLGYVISLITFILTIFISDEILKTETSTMFIVISFVGKMILYALGFYMATKVHFISLIGVFVGYLSTKVSIYIEGYLTKGGVVNK